MYALSMYFSAFMRLCYLINNLKFQCLRKANIYFVLTLHVGCRSVAALLDIARVGWFHVSSQPRKQAVDGATI